MLGGFEFYIDGVLYADPLNWSDFTESIEYDDSLNVFLFKYENKLNFSGNAYSYLYGKRNSGGICYVADLVIKKKCASGIPLEVMRGKIFVADCLFFINKCIVECSVQDDNYASLIFNNKDIKVQLDQFKSKNGVIDSYPTTGLGLTYLNASTNDMRQVPNMFKPSDGTLIAGIDISIYYLHDVFNYLVCFLTDGQCTFRSNYLDWTLPIVTEADKVKQLTITSGYNIRVYGTNTQIDISVTFAELFNEINRLYPIVLFVEYDSTGSPVIVIEDEASVKLDTPSIQIDYIPEVKEKSDNSLLYGSIRIGSATAEYSASIHSYPPTPSITFEEENMYLSGYCNTSTQKDLFGTYLVDTNIIEELIFTNTSNTGYDSNIFFLEVDPASVTFGGIFDAIKTINYDSLVSYHYNDSLLNLNVVKRNNFHNNVFNSISEGGTNLLNYSHGYTSYVTLGSHINCASGAPPPPQTTAFFDLNFVVDNALVFNGTKYTALVSGSYSFLYRLSYTIAIDYSGCYSATTNRAVTVTNVVRRYNSANVLQETLTYTEPTKYSSGSFLKTIYPTFSMLAGDYIVCSSSYESEPINFLVDSSCSVLMNYVSGSFIDFETTSTPLYTGQILNSDAGEYMCNVIDFSYPLSQDTYNTLKNNIFNSISYNIDGVNNKKAWIKRVTRTLMSTDCDFELISNINNSQ